MFCGFMFAVLVSHVPLTQYKPLFAGAAILVIIGVLDDFHELTARSRFAAQIIAYLLMTLWAGVVLKDLGPILTVEHFLLGDFAIPFTIFAAVGVANAFNMMDGLDGLSGTMAVTTLGFFCLLKINHIDSNFHILLITLSVLLAFLLFNLSVSPNRTASVFMGDAGSLFIGFILAWFFVAETQKPLNSLAPTTALWIFAIPLFDTVAIMSRRVFRKRSPFKADREHLHHILLALGWSTPRIVLVISISAITLGVIGILGEKNNVPDYMMYYLFLATFSVYYCITKYAAEKLKLTTAPTS